MDTIPQQKWVEIHGVIKYLLVINILEHGSEQSTIYATALQVATEAWDFLPSKVTDRTIWVSFTIASVCFDILLITDPLC
jgi:hypothetical protein